MLRWRLLVWIRSPSLSDQPAPYGTATEISTHDARADFDKLLTREETSHEQVPLMLPPSPKVENTSSGRKFARLPAGGDWIRTSSTRAR
jgi:hypothetical protein